MSALNIVFLLLGAYLLLFMVDLVILAFKLRATALEDSRSALIAAPGITFIGRKLLSLSENIHQKLTLLKWEVQEARERASGVKLVDAKPDGHGGFFKGIIDTVFSKLRCDAAFILSSVQDGERSVQILEARARGKEELSPKLSGYIVKFYSPYFASGDLSLIGLRDGLHSKSLTGEFCLFGYRYVIALPVNYTNHEGRAVKSLLWLGYNKNSEPYPREIELARELCSKIETEFAEKRLIDELSTKVNQQRTVSKQREEFLAHVSHDIRSPINNIRSIINLMRLEEKDAENAELLDTALGNCNDVEELISTILDYSRYQAGRLCAVKERFSVRPLIQEVIANQRVEAKLKGLDLRLHMPEEHEIIVDADKKQLRRIFNNLIGNAIKYTASGSVAIEIAPLTEGEICSIKVTDSGVGMSEEQLERLFTPFSRFHEKLADGIGLGLALTKILIELNGGSIAVESRANKGSCFEARFPCELRQKAKVEKPSFTTSAVSTVEVLVLDDDARAVDSLSRMLLKRGLNVIRCYAVSDAMSIINFSPPDYLITDWNMPDGGALRLLKYLKLINCKTKVCVLSGSSEAKAELENLNIDRFFCKADDFDKLEEWLDTLGAAPEASYEKTALASGA